MIKNYNIIRLH